MIKKVLLLTLIVLTFGINGMDIVSSDGADKKAVLAQLISNIEKESSYCVSENREKWPIRRELIRKAIIEDNIHPDYISSQIHNGPMLEAICFSDIEFIRFLLGHGASIGDVPCMMDRTLRIPFLHYAEEPQVAQMLIDAGASINSKASDGENVLHITYKPSLITFYGKRGIDSAMVDNNGDTALIRLVKKAHCGDRRYCARLRRLINIGSPLESRTNLTPYQNLTALQIVKRRTEVDDMLGTYFGQSFPRAFILAVKARNKNLKNMLETHVSRDCAGVITAYLEDRAQINKDVQELEDVVNRKLLEATSVSDKS